MTADTFAFSILGVWCSTLVIVGCFKAVAWLREEWSCRKTAWKCNREWRRKRKLAKAEGGHDGR